MAVLGSGKEELETFLGLPRTRCLYFFHMNILVAHFGLFGKIQVFDGAEIVLEYVLFVLIHKLQNIG